MIRYFVMECVGCAPIGTVDLVGRVRGLPWLSGSAVPPPAVPVPYRTDPQRPGNLKAMYEASAPLMRADLVQAMLESGVDNIQFFDAVIEDAVAGVRRYDYKAFNIIGIVACADALTSEFMHQESISGLDRDFAALVIAEERIPPDIRLFRLAEANSAIVVHHSVRDAIEARRIEGMIFYEPGEWSG